MKNTKMPPISIHSTLSASLTAAASMAVEFAIPDPAKLGLSMGAVQFGAGLPVAHRLAARVGV